MLKKMLNYVSGYKSYIAGVSTGFVGVLMQQGLITKDLGELLLTIGGTLFAIFLRAGVKKSGQ